jgi:uncharacterized phiE125 gp8 family phage protein
MGLKVITQPAVEPVTLAEAKLHLKIEIDMDAEDDLIASLISAARGQCEHMLERAVALQTVTLSVDEFPADGIRLPMSPVVQIDSVEYVDADGTTQTMAPGDYYLDDSQSPNWLLQAYDSDWPSARTEANAVRVTYQVGFEACPAEIKAWILLKVGSLYQHREGTITGTITAELAFVDRLLDRWRVY